MTRITRRQNIQSLNFGMPLDRELMAEPKMRKSSGTPRKHEEDATQIAVCAMLAKLPGTIFWATPNHLMRSGAKTGAQLGFMQKQRRMGMQAGFPDLACMFRNQHGATTLVFAELKSSKGVVSDNQELWLDKLNGFGCYTGAVRSVDDMVALLRSAGHPSLK